MNQNILFIDLIPGEAYRGTHSGFSGGYFLFLYTPYIRNSGISKTFHKGLAITVDGEDYSPEQKKATLWNVESWTFSAPTGGGEGDVRH